MCCPRQVWRECIPHTNCTYDIWTLKPTRFLEFWYLLGTKVSLPMTSPLKVLSGDFTVFFFLADTFSVDLRGVLISTPQCRARRYALHHFEHCCDSCSPLLGTNHILLLPLLLSVSLKESDVKHIFPKMFL